jgi:hypothetical protein
MVRKSRAVSQPRTFRCLLGQQARTDLERAGGAPDAFRLLLAASGGPRWLGLVGIDRALTRFLKRRDSGRLPLLGASSGAWRVAAMACDDDGAAYDELEEAYISQRYEGKPTPQQVSETVRAYLSDIFTADRLRHAIERSPFQANLTTAILKKEKPSKGRLLASFAGLPLLNALDRNLLSLVLERGLFSAGPPPDGSPLDQGLAWDSFPTRKIALEESNFVPALLASGSIPLVLAGIDAIPGAGPGHHLDGGLLDYHFEVESGGPVVYPHFSADPLPGWLDRFPPFRRLSASARSHMCLLIPSQEQLSRYPGQLYPSRVDFTRLSNDQRIRRWRATVKENQAMERELTACLEAGDLLAVADTFL